MTKTDEIRKIKKLQALAQSSNPHEAALARQKAEILMLAGSITQEEVDNADEDGVGYQTLKIRFKLSTEDKFIIPILEKFFHVVVLSKKKGSRKEVFAVGQRQHLQMAEIAYNDLTKEFRQGWKCYKVGSYSQEQSRQCFYVGMHEGIKKMLGDLGETHAPNQLVISNKDLIEKVEESEPTRATAEVPLDDTEAIQAGYFQGLKSRITKLYLKRE